MHPIYILYPIFLTSPTQAHFPLYYVCPPTHTHPATSIHTHIQDSVCPSPLQHCRTTAPYSHKCHYKL